MHVQHSMQPSLCCGWQEAHSTGLGLGEGWGEADWKCLRKSRTGSWFSRDAELAPWLLSLVIRPTDA